VSRFFSGGKVVRVGPHKNQNFPWVLLDRAILHYLTIRDYAHSRREKIIIKSHDHAGIAKGLEQERRRELGGIFSRLRKNPDNINDAEKIRLEEILLEIICRQYT
jgi:hypothetical protein